MFMQTHMPELKCTDIKTASSLLRDSSGGRAIFQKLFFFLYFVKKIIQVYSTCISHSLPFFIHPLIQTDWPNFFDFDSLISLNFSSKFKLFRFADMLTKTD